MNAHKLQLKIYATPASAKAVEPEALIPVFHRWIKDHVLPEMVIDVANYGHVPEGPGVVLIGHGSDYYMEAGRGPPGSAAQPEALGPARRAATALERCGAPDAARGGAAREGRGARRASSRSRPTSCCSA